MDQYGQIGGVLVMRQFENEMQMTEGAPSHHINLLFKKQDRVHEYFQTLNLLRKSGTSLTQSIYSTSLPDLQYLCFICIQLLLFTYLTVASKHWFRTKTDNL